MDTVNKPITFEEIKKKMSDPKYRADDDNGLSCKTYCDFLLTDHCDGWPYWGTIGFEESDNVECFFVTQASNKDAMEHKVFYAAFSEKKLKNEILDNVDVRNLEPISKKEFAGRFNFISTMFWKEAGHEMRMMLDKKD